MKRLGDPRTRSKENILLVFSRWGIDHFISYGGLYTLLGASISLFCTFLGFQGLLEGSGSLDFMFGNLGDTQVVCP